MGFSRQEYWSGLPFPSPGDLPDPGIKPRSPALQADALTSEPPEKPTWTTACLTQWNYKPCHVGPPKTDGSWWGVLTKRGPLEKGMDNHFCILALRTPRTVWKGPHLESARILCGQMGVRVYNESHTGPLWSDLERSKDRKRIRQDQTLKMGTATNQDLHTSEVGRGCWQRGSFSRTLRAAFRQTGPSAAAMSPGSLDSSSEPWWLIICWAAPLQTPSLVEARTGPRVSLEGF